LWRCGRSGSGRLHLAHLAGHLANAAGAEGVAAAQVNVDRWLKSQAYRLILGAAEFLKAEEGCPHHDLITGHHRDKDKLRLVARRLGLAAREAGSEHRKGILAGRASHRFSHPRPSAWSSRPPSLAAPRPDQVGVVAELLRG